MFTNLSLCLYIIPLNEFAQCDPYFGQSHTHIYLRNLRENETEIESSRFIKGRSIKPAAFLFLFKNCRVFSLAALSIHNKDFCCVHKEQAHGSFTRVFFGGADLGYYPPYHSME
jgi:hypothetical protein